MGADAQGNEFGGDWTEIKLDLVRRYIISYLKIMQKNPRASFYRTIYVDAFAGSGIRVPRTTNAGQSLLPFVDDEPDSSIKLGSARIVLDIEPGFDRHLFIEKDREKACSLQSLVSARPDKARATEIACCDANERLAKLLDEGDWNRWRALVFLDPFGMQVDWETVAALGATEAVDLWYLFPLGGMTRMLPRNQLPSDTWADKVTRVLGTTAWKEEFYAPNSEDSLFGARQQMTRNAKPEDIADYVNRRLTTAFAAVAPNPLVLHNTKGSPMFLLCFACANKRGAGPAISIAKHLLGH